MSPKYNWLYEEFAPKMIVQFLKIYGVHEAQGNADNPEILSWAKELNIKDYIHDSIAWCGLTMAIICKRADKPVVDGALWALNWRHWEQPVYEPMLGDVLVFSRTGGGHVGLYIAESEYTYHVGGGNESDAVNIVEIAKSRLVAARRPIWKIAQPPNVRKIIIDGSGHVSMNEA